MMLIDVRGLKKTYVTYRRGATVGDVATSILHRRTVRVEALKGIDFSIAEGELVGFLGPNGAGKSTTLKILSGVLFPTAGEAHVLGFVPWKERRKYVGRIGAVFGQKSQLIWDIPPLDSFLMNRAIYRIPDALFVPTLERLREMLGIEAVMRQPTRNLSLGERMRCEFVMAMLHGPRVVFLDEPTIGLDVIAKEAIHAFIKEMNRQGVTFILTTHDLDDIERLARRVIVINSGEIVFDDTLAALRRYSGNRKRLTLVTERDQSGIEGPGVSLVERRTPTDSVYELDLDVLDLDGFVAGVSRTRRITDMSMEEPPIENVVKELYGRNGAHKE